MIYINKEYLKPKQKMSLVPMLAIIFFAALLHASFQLGVSLLTMISGHSLGNRRSHAHLLKLNIAYIAGVGTLITLIFASLAHFASILSYPREPVIWWIIIASLNIGIGLTVTLFYYRKGPGTELWLPRSFAQYLATRTKKTTHSAEAFTLGMGSVVSELLFIIGPLSAATLFVIRYDSSLQILGLIAYVFIALLPLLIITVMVGSGHKISTIQRWRERNKRFLQYAAGSGLIILGLYIFITEVVSVLALEDITIL
jgi:cytochrome c biogenesis protein CcdA